MAKEYVNDAPIDDPMVVLDLLCKRWGDDTKRVLSRWPHEEPHVEVMHHHDFADGQRHAFRVTHTAVEDLWENRWVEGTPKWGYTEMHELVPSNAGEHHLWEERMRLGMELCSEDWYVYVHAPPTAAAPPARPAPERSSIREHHHQSGLVLAPAWTIAQAREILELGLNPAFYNAPGRAPGRARLARAAMEKVFAELERVRQERNDALGDRRRWLRDLDQARAELADAVARAEEAEDCLDAIEELFIGNAKANPQGLLPCPFCGTSDARILPQDGGWKMANCARCGATVREVTESDETIVAKWNCRGGVPVDAQRACGNARMVPRKDGFRVGFYNPSKDACAELVVRHEGHMEPTRRTIVPGGAVDVDLRPADRVLVDGTTPSIWVMCLRKRTTTTVPVSTFAQEWAAGKVKV